MKARLAPRARGDLLEAVHWIAREDWRAAEALREAVLTAAARLGEFPEMGKRRLELAEPNIRFLALSAFPYVLVYNATARPPLILRVLHGARDLPDILAEL